MKQSNKLTIGILAHVDAGKTTLSEGILYRNGITRSLGRVDHGDAFLDTYELERQRGITIFSKQAVFPLGEGEQRKIVTLLDTPGHMDFSAEMERTLQVLDYAILVISGPDGVTGQVQTLWKLLEHYQIPTFIFINKMDQVGADLSKTLRALKSSLSESCILFDTTDTDTAQKEDFYEALSLSDETALEEYLETGELQKEQIQRLIARRKVFPCCSGSALKMEGIDEFLSIIDRYTSIGEYPDEFGSRIYKISRDDQGNRLTHMKITGGMLKVRDVIGENKVNQIRIYNGVKFEAVDMAEAGTICAVTGLDQTRSGEGLGFESEVNKPVLDTVLTYQVILPEGQNQHDAYVKLAQIEEEIPELHIIWEDKSQEIKVQLMGEIQAEILKKLVSDRFGMDIEFGSETIIYKETISDDGPVEGVGHFEPLRHYAEVHLLMEALPAGSGLVFDSCCSEDDFDRNWQRLVMTHLMEREHPGVLTGSVITDMKITIAAGRAHVKHTEGGDFRQATYRAIRHGLRRAKSILLEPYYEYRLELPSTMVGRAMSDIQKMAGTCEPAESIGEMSVLTGTAPVSTMNGYQKDVIAYTKGAGRLFCVVKGYFPCHNTEEVTAAIGYDPDADTDNPCGSVFCSHGAGTVIPWYEVEDYMHLDSCLAPKKEDEKYSPSGRKTRIQYTEKELEAIFERTYGVSKREKNRFKKSSRIITSDPSAGYPRPKNAFSVNNTEECLLIDGYNVIFAWEELKEMSKLNLEAARDMLIEILRNYQGYKGGKMILVFDAYKQPGNIGTSEDYDGLKVVYTKEGELADQYIEKFVTENSKKLRITVATSDSLEQMMIFGQGALRMPVRELKERVLAANEEIREKYLGK